MNPNDRLKTFPKHNQTFPQTFPAEVPQPIGTTASEEQLLVDAAKIDSAADAQGLANPLDQVIAGEGAAAAPAPEPVADPAIQQSLVLLVTMGTTLMTAQYRWDDPGDKWREEVGKLGALVFDRYLPNFLADQGEIVALVILVSSYAGSNLVKTKTAGGSHGNPGAKGVGQEHFVVTDAPGPRSSNVGHS